MLRCAHGFKKNRKPVHKMQLVVRGTGRLVMARRNLQNSVALEWSLVSLLQACIDVVLAVLILACALIHFLTLRIIRASGSYVPCVLCSAHVQQGEKERGFVVEDSSLIRSRSVVPLRDKEISGNFCRGASAECSTALIPVQYRHGEVIEMSMEDSCEGTESGSPSSPVNRATSDLEDRKVKESADRKQELKGKELMEALKAERESLAALYVELDQERNSSATAASEALAMISRLQEEKAALQLEARQFQRMVMENVLYDQEAIEVLQDIIVNHEEEKIALEDEVRVCREKLDSLLLMEGERGEVEWHTFSFQETVAERRRNVQISEPEMMIETVKIGPCAKVVNQDQSGDRYLEKIDKADSQILTSEFSVGVHKPFSIHLEESVFDNATCNPNLKTSLQDSVVSNEEDENENAPLLHSLQTGRENGSQDLVGNERNQIGELGIRNDLKPEDTKFISLKRSWSSRGSQERALNTLDKDREDRCIEEKRISMLEYVWKLEGQLQQYVGGPSIQVIWPKSAEESRSKTQSPSQGDSSSMRSKKRDTSMQEITRDDSLRRRLFAEGDCMEQGWVEMPHLEGGKVTNDSIFTGVNDGRLDDDGSCRISMESSQERPNEAVYVQDVYEVKNSMYEGPVVFTEGVGNSHDSSVVEMYQPISESLGKADFVNLEEEDPGNRAEQELDCPSRTTILAQDTVDCVTEREAIEERVQYKDLHMLSLPRRRDIKTLMEEEVKQLTILLKVLETDKYVMKQTIETLRMENEEMKLPEEISQHLYELCGMEEKEMRLKYSVPLTLQSQTSMSKRRRCIKKSKGSLYRS